MLRAALLLALASAVLAQPAIRPRIAGGSPAELGSFPAQVVISRLTEFLCGGTLIDEQHVLTTAKCIEGVKPTDIKVTAGVVQRDQAEADKQQTGFVQKVYRYTTDEKVQEESITNSDKETITYPLDDIAVLRVGTKFEITSNVKPIALADGKADDTVECKVSGWGATKEGETPSRTLSSLLINYRSLDTCIDNLALDKEQGKKIKNSCVKIQGTKKSLCKGDEGSGIICKDRLQGMVSWGADCTNYYAFAVDVPAYSDWINKAIKQSYEEFTTTTTPPPETSSVTGSTDGSSQPSSATASTGTPKAGSSTPGSAPTSASVSAPVLVLLGALSLWRLY